MNIEQENEYIKSHYLTTPIKRLGEEIGRSYTCVMGRIKKIGLIIPAEVIERNKQIGRIKPGNISFNKGKKLADYLPPETIDRMKKTQFKKGDLPHNARQQDGEISVRKDTKTGIEYLYIRVSLANWELLQRYNYRKFIGEIPDGCVVALKDGDPKNCHPFNLELLTQRENMIRNTIHRYPPELISTLKALSKLKKTIKKYGTEQTC